MYTLYTKGSDNTRGVHNNMTAQQKQEKHYYQSTISQHDKSIMWIYYTSLKDYERHHHTAINEVFKQSRYKDVTLIIHKLDADDSVIEFTERNKE